MTNRFGGTDDWEDGDLLYADDMLDTANQLKWRECTISFGDSSEYITSIIGHSATVLSMIITDGTIYNSTDSGATWTSKNSAFEDNSFMRICVADTTHAVALEYSASGEVAFTSNSGTTWTSVTAHPFATALYDVSFTTASLIVLAGDDDVGAKHIVYSTDDGANWTDPTTAPSAKCYCVNMFSATVGYAVDSNKKIWKTTNGGDVWVDTTHTITNAADDQMSILCISATSCVIATVGYIEIYNNTTGTSAIKIDTGGSLTECLGIVENSNGYIYVAFGSTTRSSVEIYRTKDDGVSWEITFLASTALFDRNNVWKCNLQKYNSTDLLFVPKDATTHGIIIRERQD